MNRLLAILALFVLAACGGGDDQPAAGTTVPQPGDKLSDDLSWVREMAPGGAFAYSADQTIYLLELDGDEPKRVGRGYIPEFSPDGSKVAWVDNDRLSVCNRDGSGTRQLHDRMFKHGGAHWLDDEHIAAILTGPKGYRWYRFGLDGSRTPMPELDQFGISKKEARETDVRQAADGIWTHVAYRTWKTSDGKSGPLDGGCACSISPDGKSITALQGSHTELKINPVRDGGVSHELKWLYKGRFDNHRWSSNDERFLVGVREKPARMVIIDWRSGRAGAFGRSDHRDKTRMYGDFTKADGKGGKAMPALLPPDQRQGKATTAATDRGEPVVLEAWPYRTEGMVYLFESRSAPNEFRSFSNDPPTKSTGQLRGGAVYDRFGRLDLKGGRYEVTSEVALDGEFTIEFVSTGGTEGHAVALGELTLTPADPQPTHHIFSITPEKLDHYVNGVRFDGTEGSPPENLSPIVFGKGWDGKLEAIALFDRAIDADEARKRHALISQRLAQRQPAPRTTVEAKLLHYTPPIPIAEMDTYRRLLCEHVFEVTGVADGDIKLGEKIRVLAWSVLDLQTLPEVWKGREGEAFMLTLEPEEAHPDLVRKERVEAGYEGDDQLDLRVYLLDNRATAR